LIRRCEPNDWSAVRRLHIRLALTFPVVVDVELNEILSTPDDYWMEFVHTCALDTHQALFVAHVDGPCVGMGHVHLEGTVARLGMMYVDAGARRHGVGSALVGAQEVWARAAGALDLVCHIPEASAGGRLAERLGWHRTAEVFFTKNGFEERKWTADEPPGEP
jgi:GNAT superfamily N-acetyltransferase